MATDLFTRAGHALFGPTWRVLLAEQLGINDSSVRNMAKGKTRVPPGVWRDIAKLLETEAMRLLMLKTEAHNAAVRANWNKDQPTNGDKP